MGIGKTHGYTGNECRKEVSEEGEDVGGEEEEVVENIGGILFRVNQENSHEQGDFLSSSDVSRRHSRMWQGE